MSLSPPLRASIPLSLAVLIVAVTATSLVRDRATSFRHIEESSVGQAVALGRIVAPTLRGDLVEGDASAAEDQIARLRLMPSVTLALVCDGDDRVLYATDERLRDVELDATRPASASLLGRVRATLVPKWEIAPDGATLLVASPVLVQPLPGELHPSHVTALYTETDLAAAKARALGEIVERASLAALPLLLACFLAWRSSA